MVEHSVPAEQRYPDIPYSNQVQVQGRSGESSHGQACSGGCRAQPARFLGLSSWHRLSLDPGMGCEHWTPRALCSPTDSSSPLYPDHPGDACPAGALAVGVLNFIQHCLGSLVSLPQRPLSRAET